MKKFITIFLILSMFSISGFAQGTPVIDMANLMNAIEQLYQTYQQIQNGIEQVQNTYKQIEQATKQMASLNFEDLESIKDNFAGLDLSENPFEVITAVRDSAQDITKYVNDRMNSVNRLTDALTKESISFGGMDFSVADLCGAGDPNKTLYGFAENAIQHIGDMAKSAADGYAGKLTYEEKRAIMKKYGMSPRNYAQWQITHYNLSKSLEKGNVEGTFQSLEQQYEQDAAEVATLQKILSNIPEGSVKAQLEANAKVEVQNLQQLQKLRDELNQGNTMISEFLTKQQAEEFLKQQKEQEEKEQQEENLKSSSMADDVNLY